MRRDKVVYSLYQFCLRRKLKEKVIIDKEKIILRANQPRLWEIALYPIPVIAFWIWYYFEDSKEISGLLLISGFTIYFIWTYFEIAKGINEISINLKTNEIDIINLD